MLICVFHKSAAEPIFEFHRGVNYADETIALKFEEALLKEKIKFRVRENGTIEYSTYDLARVRKIERTVNPHPGGFCCMDSFENRAKLSRFLKRLNSATIRVRLNQANYGFTNVSWNRNDEDTVDQIFQEIEVTCLEEFKEKHAYCN